MVNRLNVSFLADLAIARAVFFLILAAKKIEADIFIGHNQAGLCVAVKAAKQHKALCGFDAEDFHRNELSDDPHDKGVILRSYLEHKYLPAVDYLTVSSPFIAAEYQRLFPDMCPVVVLNTFPKNPIPFHITNDNGPVRLFWFSQTIGTGRGLEEVFSALELLKDYQFELHLLGSRSFQDKYSLFGSLKNQNIKVFIYDPIQSDGIAAFASQFDIGLATERNTPFNRDICLTNKIFTYLQAGLSVIASDTIAQTQLLSEYPGIGQIYEKGNPKSLADILIYYYNNRTELIKSRNTAANTAFNYLNWENEGKVFLNIIEQISIDR